MTYTVKIIKSDGRHTIVERAGLHGQRTIVSITGPHRTISNEHPHKIAGWKTVAGALNFIESAKKERLVGWIRKFEVISNDLEMFYDYLKMSESEFSVLYGISKTLINFDMD